MRLKSTFLNFTFSFCLILLGITNSQAQCYTVGTGADGAYTATVNTTLVGGTYNFTTFTINSGVTVSVTGTQPLIIYCTGAVTIDGILTARGGDGADGITYTSGGNGGVGVAGGANGGAGTFSASVGPLPAIAGSGLGGANNQGDGWSGGGGAGYATVGASSGGVGGFGGPIYGNANISGYEAGSGGGGGSGGYNCGAGGGGAGGGVVYIASGASITIGAGGGINCNGGNGGSDGTGNCGGGAGGSGGAIWLSSVSITNNGILGCNGGFGGASTLIGAPYYGVGSNGSVGRIRLDYNGSLLGSGTTNPAVGAHFNAPSPMVTTIFGVTPNSCFGGSNGSATVAASGGSPGYTYSWSPSGGTAATASGLTNGSYTCTITDAVGCIQTQTATITSPTALTASISAQNEACNGGSNATAAITVNGGTPSYSYNWTPIGGNGATTPGLPVGTYTCTVFDNNGCFITQSVSITEPAVLTSTAVSVVNPTTCGGNDGLIDITTTGGTGPYFFFWNTFVSTEDLSSITAGSYYLSVTDANGCATSVTVPVYDPAGPIVSIDLNLGIVCQTTQAPFVLTGGLPVGGTYSGTGVSGGTFDPMTASIGWNVITYTYTDPNTNCTNSYLDSIQVDVCAGINNPNSGIETIFPNPNNGHFTIQLNANENSAKTVEITNTLGQVVQSFILNENSKQVDLSAFGTGVYLMKVSDEAKVNVYRIVFQ